MLWLLGLENRDHEIVCINCGQIDGYDPIQEFCGMSMIINIKF